MKTRKTPEDKSVQKAVQKEALQGAYEHIMKVYKEKYEGHPERMLVELQRALPMFTTPHYRGACLKILQETEEKIAELNRPEDTSAKWLELLTEEQK